MKNSISVILILLLPLFSNAQCFQELAVSCDTSNTQYSLDDQGSIWKLHPDYSGTGVVEAGLFDFSGDWESIYQGPTNYGASFGIKKDSSLWTWGGNSEWVCGLGHSNPVPNPTQIGSQKWKQVHIHMWWVTGIQANGTLHHWGSGPATPTQMGSDSDWKKVLNNFNHLYSIKENGTFWAGSRDSLPSQVLGITNAVDIHSAANSIFVRQADGTMFKVNYNMNTEQYETQGIPGGNWLDFVEIKSENWSTDGLVALDGNGMAWRGDHNGLPTRRVYSKTDQGTVLMNNWISVGASFQTIFALDSSGVLWSATSPDTLLSPLVYNSQDSICTPPFVGVLQDNQGNCDAGIGVEGIGVQIEPGSIQGVTNSAGVVWLLDLPDGNYTATLDTVNNPFVANCGYEINFAVQGNKIQGTTPKFYVAELIACPKPIIGIKNVRARSCDKSSVRVNVSQLSYSGAPFTGGQVRLRFSEYFLLDSATVNYSTTNPNEYLFELNGINIGEGKVFDFFGTIDCNAPMGISLCFEAEILDLESCIISRDKTHENDLCSGDWDNSSLAVYSTCVGDSVVFEIRNVGQGNMECPSEFNVFLNENHYLSDSVQLDAQMSYFLTVASQGEGMVLNADQHPMHPGNSHPMTFIEACGSDQSKWESGKRMRHADDDKEDYKDIHCSVVRNSYDPNDKTGFPMGLGNENIIEQNQDLTYVVNFQNTGNDTAYVVVVRDTLDSDLDFFSVMPLGASHEYSYRPLAGRVLEWTFSNINLLDSASNEEKSNGYFSFKVKQHKDLALETKITNRVGIYFDHNPPIITNTAMHTIGDLNAGGSVGVVEKMMPLADELIVVPNPNFGLVRVVNKTNKYINKYSLVDLQGRVLRGGNTLGNSVEIDLHNVPPGIYIFKSEGTRAVKIIKK